MYFQCRCNLKIQLFLHEIFCNHYCKLFLLSFFNLWYVIVIFADVEDALHFLNQLSFYWNQRFLEEGVRSKGGTFDLPYIWPQLATPKLGELSQVPLGRQTYFLILWSSSMSELLHRIKNGVNCMGTLWSRDKLPQFRGGVNERLI